MMLNTHSNETKKKKEKNDDEKVRAHKCATEDAIFIGAENLLNIQRF